MWTDYPGSPAARKALVNDLDLTVRAEGYNGKSLYGNGGSVTDSSSPDRFAGWGAGLKWVEGVG